MEKLQEKKKLGSELITFLNGILLKLFPIPKEFEIKCFSFEEQKITNKREQLFVQNKNDYSEVTTNMFLHYLCNMK